MIDTSFGACAPHFVFLLAPVFFYVFCFLFCFVRFFFLLAPPISFLWQVVIKARSKYINVADKMCEFNDSFMLYMTTRLPNPHLSPENQAKVSALSASCRKP